MNDYYKSLALEKQKLGKSAIVAGLGIG